MEIITISKVDLKNLLKDTVTEVLEGIEKKKNKKTWISADEAIEILKCSKPTLRNYVDRDRAIRIDKVSERKTRYSREDCENKASNPRYRYFLEN